MGRIFTVEVGERVGRALHGGVYAVFDDAVVELTVLDLDEVHRLSVGHSPEIRANYRPHEVSHTYNKKWFSVNGEDIEWQTYSDAPTQPTVAPPYTNIGSIPLRRIVSDGVSENRGSLDVQILASSDLSPETRSTLHLQLSRATCMVL